MKKHSQRAAMPVETPKETPPSTVRGKIEAIQREIKAIQIKRGAIEEGAAEIHKGAAEVQAGIRAMEANINKQIDKYKDAIAVFYAGVGDFNNSILVQSKENKKAASAIYSGVREIQAGIEAMRSSIEDKVKENTGYTRNFYG
jgi:peptidoglycan hydrolase CwlO-like protein